MSPIREGLPDKFKHLFDNYDQDNTLILTEGTNAGIFQSTMMRPANIQPVYPLRDMSRIKYVELDESKKGPIIVFNNEPHDIKSLLKFKNHVYLQNIIAQMANLT
jgi:hypothetical protein